MANGKNGGRPKFHHINTPLRRHGGIPFINFINFLRRLAKNLPCHSARLIGNASGKKWISMINEEKVKYYDIASEKRIEFDRAMAEFNNKMKSGEFDEIDE
ncbi:hypothetical protein JHK82_019759 [Glycine max]|uniref:HMG box domain-containing protein n=2 Tax=Glycine subgen. Soja TaxID=1462606 RepID=K7L3P1_SOYBN|nr:hypothetical protein JHK87_019640 [Glycine soja]KAG5144064.1 hypothetical protein JHK82_019759 [Glycine max]KAH1088472.1 hypothetical protein GYH30_019488 [Glycine max]RZC04515.1 High mobility group B protein 14 [Glycine soja]